MSSRAAVWVHIGLLLCCAAGAPAAVVFVDGRASACGDGQTWATAYKYLQDALTAARNSGGTITEVWVAAGTYQPDRSCASPAGSRDRAATFSLVNGVALRGGFAGNEDPATFDPATRDFEANPTILTGDLGGDDGVNFVNNAENSYSVVRAGSVGTATLLDGFHISAGNANGPSNTPIPYHQGGGMAIISSSVVISNCNFRDNSAYSEGGGVYTTESTPKLIACRFSGNRVTNGNGSGMSGSNVLLTNCLFTGNEFYNRANASIINCTFTGDAGSGIRNDYTALSLANSIVWCSITGGDPTRRTVRYCCTQGYFSGEGNFSWNPELLADGRPSRTSRCINAGDNTAVLEGLTTDIEGKPRFMEAPFYFIPGKPGQPPRPIVDMGAYEAPAEMRQIYVKAGAAPGGDGRSWQTAYAHLQDALPDAAAPSDAFSAICLAQGEYKPDRSSAQSGGTGDRMATFTIPSGVYLYGGFPGEPGQEDDWNARDPKRYETVLSGDLAGDDAPGFVNNGENSYHVVTGAADSALADGLTITGGNANGSSPEDSGGGMYNWGMEVRGCVLRENAALSKGGGIYSYSLSPLINCDFLGNTARQGGGVYSSYKTERVINCRFVGNSAREGGGLFSPWGTSVVNCTFVTNSAQTGGGGWYNSSVINPTDAVATNCIFWGNSASSYAQVYGPLVTYSCVQGGYTGTGNIGSDPLFVNAAAGDLRLGAGSPCIDAGSNAAVPAGTVADILGLPRFWDDPATADCQWVPGTCGAAPIVDMGAHEFVVIPGDMDNDLDVDADDLAGFLACGSGPSLAAAAECLGGDGDGDGDVDGIDFAVLQRCWSGAGILGDPSCR